MYDPRLYSVIIHPTAGSNIYVRALSIAKINFIQYSSKITTKHKFRGQLFVESLLNGLMNVFIKYRTLNTFKYILNHFGIELILIKQINEVILRAMVTKLRRVNIVC